MNKLEKALGIIIFGGLLFTGIGLYKDKKIVKYIGLVTTGLSSLVLSGYYCKEYETKP